MVIRQCLYLLLKPSGYYEIPARDFPVKCAAWLLVMKGTVCNYWEPVCIICIIELLHNNKVWLIQCHNSVSSVLLSYCIITKLGLVYILSQFCIICIIELLRNNKVWLILCHSFVLSVLLSYCLITSSG